MPCASFPQEALGFGFFEVRGCLVAVSGGLGAVPFITLAAARSLQAEGRRSVSLALLCSVRLICWKDVVLAKNFLCVRSMLRQVECECLVLYRYFFFFAVEVSFVLA